MSSGAVFHRAYRRATQQAFLEAHEMAFAYFGEMFGGRICCPGAVSFVFRFQPIRTLVCCH
jgi:hypothetical protein